MYLAMNRFKISHGFEVGFEELWRERDSYLKDVPGFESFALLKGGSEEDHTLYASHTIWKSESDFKNWTESDHFRKAHAQKSAEKGTYLGHPKLELFEAVLVE
tara:strand:+ start:765 stop:1073 length:309 start_codon:yes stop_codon:yes gene_type:complete